MELNCPINPVYRTSVQQKLHSKEAAKKLRYGVVQLKEMLRQKCRVRIRDARQNSFEQCRLTLKEVLREELAKVEDDIQLQDEIYKELMDEFNELFVKQFEQEENYIINVAEQNVAFCPICQIATLETDLQSNGYKCACGIRFNYTGTLDDLNLKLQQTIEKHEQNCQTNLMFFVEPNTSSQNILNAMCENCDYFCSL